MNRRGFLNLLWKLSLVAIPFSTKSARARRREPSIRERKLVLIAEDASSPTCQNFLNEVTPHLAKRYPNWRETLVVWDARLNFREIRDFIEIYGSKTELLTYPILVSVPEAYELEGEVETWSPGWLLHFQQTSRLEECYPVSGGWWSVDGDWNPSIKKVRDHLYKSPNHESGNFILLWLEQLKLPELQSLHSDHHREMTNEGTVHWKRVNMECPHIETSSNK